MKSTLIVTTGMISALALFLAGCGDDGPRPTGGVDAMPDAGGAPAMPALGAQIDRMGRPLISTMLIETFNPDEPLRQSSKDNYNLDDEPATWLADWADEIQSAAAVFDALDSRGEVNQFGCTNPLAELGIDAEAADTKGRYQGLAEILARDMLYVDSSKATCDNGFMGYEIEAVIQEGDDGEVTGCGGRKPTEDVADLLYGFLIGGLNATISDGIQGDDGEAIAAADAGFPFLGEPHPTKTLTE